MSLLKIYSSSKLECQNTGYFNKYCKSILFTPSDDTYIPAWYLVEDDELDEVYLENLNTKDLQNGVITVQETGAELIGEGYSTAYGNSRVYANKQIDPNYIAGVNRLRLVFTSPARTYYSEIFKTIE
jgi:hypothetical protein